MQTPAERSLQARAAAHAKWSRTDSREGTVAARRGFLTRFENEVDPDRSLPPAERARRAEHARRAYMLDLGRRRQQVRRERAEGDS